VAEIPDRLVDRHVATSATGWSSPALGGTREAMPERRQPHQSPLEFEVGDDVVHATFGEGVVTGVEPGNVIVVRFAGQADERKLMADYAPLRRAG
jgi:DNA helicase-2/ATP-dependent DNA helicase PcrA